MSVPTTALSDARAQVNTNTTPISQILRTPEQTAIRNKILPIIANDPVFSKSGQ